jgi:hypothetical protein
MLLMQRNVSKEDAETFVIRIAFECSPRNPDRQRRSVSDGLADILLLPAVHFTALSPLI